MDLLLVVVSAWLGLNALLVLAAWGRAVYRQRRARRRLLGIRDRATRPADGMTPPPGSVLGR